MLLIDLGHIMTDLSDPQWLGETGEVVVGARVNNQTRFVFPPRLDPANVEFPVQPNAGHEPGSGRRLWLHASR